MHARCLGIALLAGCAPLQPPGNAGTRPGLESFLAAPPSWALGKRLGLISNVASIDHRGRSAIDLLASRRDLRLVALFAFEHGLRADAPPGQKIESGTDARTGLPVFSLYGDVREPTPQMLRDIDLLVYDVQDVGARPYTRISTMALAMRAAAAKGIPFAVLDRPNPIGGDVVEGPVLDTAFASFVGMYPTALRHGMTVGELAKMYNERFGIGAELHVVPLVGWRREMFHDETGLPFVAPSPNLRRLAAALLYPGMVLVEGTNLSEGRGSDSPFEQLGAPWLDAERIASELRARRLPGVDVRAVRFSVGPGANKFAGTTIPGIRLVVTDRRSFRAVRTVALLLDTIRRRHPAEFAWLGASRGGAPLPIDRLAGTDRLRASIDAGSVEALLAEWEEQAAQFRVERDPFLLYR